MLGVFVSLDFFLFYIFGSWCCADGPYHRIWGFGQPGVRGYQVLLYTLAGSLLMLVAIIAESSLSTTRWNILTLMQVGPNDPHDFQNWVSAFAAAFAVKCRFGRCTPGCPTPRGGPTAGSIILAGVMLKLGAYGFIRFAMPITPAGAATFAGSWWASRDTRLFPVRWCRWCSPT